MLDDYTSDYHELLSEADVLEVKSVALRYVDWGVNGLNPKCLNDPDSKVHGANMGPTWVLPAPSGPHEGPLNLAVCMGLFTIKSANTTCVTTLL